MNRLWQDTRLALRGFKRSPTFVVSAVLILGGGIGVAVAMWTVFSAVLLHPIPVDNPRRGDHCSFERHESNIDS